MDGPPTKQSIVTTWDEAVRATSAAGVGSGRWPVVGAEKSGKSWQQELKEAVRDPLQLVHMLGLATDLASQAQRAAEAFGLFAPRGYVARMRQGDPHDPLLRQILPLDMETQSVEGFISDPVGDTAAALQPGLLQKYRSRALLVTTGACAIHCRYCFRRHFPYSESPRSPSAWEPALAQIAQDESIDEVILSGGDPLTLVDEHLAGLAQRIAQIEHVQRLRIHTRLPIVIPSRVTNQLLDWLTSTRLTPIVVVHANHAQELDAEVLAALARLTSRGVPLLNQAVLLKGVNDDVETLVQLSQALVNARVMPYYLHQLDRVAGAAHFEVPIERGRQLIAELRGRLPGYAVPRYVIEQPGEISKTLIA